MSVDIEMDDLEAVAAVLGGLVVDTGGGCMAIAFDADDHSRHLAVHEDFAVWIVTYEHNGDDGQREWVEAADGSPNALRVAGKLAEMLPLA